MSPSALTLIQLLARSALCLASLFCLAATALADERPNIVVFVTDDQSPTLGCYGDPVAQTPNLDRLAAEGTRFTNAYATTASCSASRSVILSGLQNHANGQYGHLHHYHKFNTWDNVVTLPRLMKAAGYRCARIGKFHVGPEEVYRFETVLSGNTRNPVQMADNSRAFIAEDDARPFFLYFCTSDPHRGGGVAEELPHKPDRFGNRPEGQPREGLEQVIYDPADVPVPAFLPDTPECRAELAQYYQSQSRIDQGMGRLIEILEESGVWDNTVVLFTADHGMAFPGAKTNCYVPARRVPFIVRDPRAAKRGIACDALFNFTCITPTVLDLAGGLGDDGRARPDIVDAIEPVTVTHQRSRHLKPGVFHGRSIVPIIEQERPEGWDETTASHTFHEIQMYYPMRVVQTRDWELIWNIAHPLTYPAASDLWAAATWQAQYKKGMDAPYGVRTVRRYLHRPEFELYHLSEDPNEARNLADDPAAADVLQRLKERVKEFQHDTADPWIVKWKYE